MPALAALAPCIHDDEHRSMHIQTRSARHHERFSDWSLDRRTRGHGKPHGSLIRYARVSILEDSGPQPQQGADDRADGQMALASCFSRARPILSALVTGVKEGDAVIVATDPNGFPVAQRVV